jgi:hypothetical protein
MSSVYSVTYVAGQDRASTFSPREKGIARVCRVASAVSEGLLFIPCGS